MQDVKMRNMKLKKEIAGHGIAGHEIVRNDKLTRAQQMMRWATVWPQ